MADSRSRQSEPSFQPTGQLSPGFVLLATLWERRWVRVAIAVVVAALLVATLVQKLWIDPQLTAVKYKLTLIGQNDGPVFEIDKTAGVIAVHGAQYGPESFVLIGERVLLPASMVDSSAAPGAWLSFPADAVMEHPALFSIRHLIDSFDLGVKECVLPGDVADALVKATLAQTFASGEDEQRYNLCGSAISGGRAADGSGVRVQDERIRPSEVFRPAAEAVTVVEDMGGRTSTLTALAAGAFRDQDRVQG